MLIVVPKWMFCCVNLGIYLVLSGDGASNSKYKLIYSYGMSSPYDIAISMSSKYYNFAISQEIPLSRLIPFAFNRPAIFCILLFSPFSSTSYDVYFGCVLSIFPNRFSSIYVWANPLIGKQYKQFCHHYHLIRHQQCM